MNRPEPDAEPITAGERIAEIRRLCSGMSMALLVGIAVFVTSSVGDIANISQFLAAVGAAVVTAFCWSLFLYGVRGIWWKCEEARQPAPPIDDGF